MADSDSSQVGTIESKSDTVSLSLGLGIGYGAEVPGGLLKAKVGVSLGLDTSQTQTFSKTVSIGSRYTVDAEPDLHGFDYAPVIMSCGCYHRYTYETADPNGLVGGTGQTIDAR